MAYLIGIVTDEEAALLQRRGWELKDLDQDCLDEVGALREDTNNTSDRLVMVHVENDLFKVMDGPDWEKSVAPFNTLCPNCGKVFRWDNEDGLEGQTCGGSGCGYIFTGKEKGNG